MMKIDENELKNSLHNPGFDDDRQTSTYRDDGIE
jgi:hypothetical protein